MEPQLEPATLTRLFMQFSKSHNIVHCLEQDFLDCLF